MRGRTQIFVLLASLTTSSAVVAQPVQSGIPAPPLKPLDQGVEDVDPLSASFRDMQVDFRQPLGFFNVYRAPGMNDQLMRASGALYAVFPQSSYLPTKAGLLPLIPAGTVFHIGLPDAPAAGVNQPDTTPQTETTSLNTQTQARVYSFAPSEIDSHVSSMLGEHPENARDAQDDQLSRTRALRHGSSPARIGPTVANDETYRSLRIAQLIDRAAKAAQAESRSGSPPTR